MWPKLKIWSTRVLTAGSGHVFSYGSRFIRNIILARLIPGEFGTTVAITAMVGLAVATDFGLDRYVMLRDSRESLSSAHLLSIVRGLLVTLAFLAFAPAAASLFGVPETSRSFQLAAIIAGIEGLNHFAIKQIRRDFKYGPDAKAQIAASTAAVGIVVPAIWVLHDHRAIIVSLATETIVYAAASHLLATVPYQVRFDRNELKSALNFSLPLMLNGLGLALIQQLDRFLIGAWFGLKELATYAVFTSLAIVPGSLLLATFGNIGLSYIIDSSREVHKYTKRYDDIFVFHCIISLLYVFFMVLTLDILVPVIFGPAFSASPFMLAVFALIGYLRLLRGGAPTTLLLSESRTRELALLNLSAVFGFLIAAVAVRVGGDLNSALTGFLAGEVLTFLLFLITVQIDNPAAKVGKAVAATFPVPVVIIAVYLLNPELAPWPRGGVFVTGILGIGVQFAYQVLRNYNLGLIGRLALLRTKAGRG